MKITALSNAPLMPGGVGRALLGLSDALLNVKSLRNESYILSTLQTDKFHLVKKTLFVEFGTGVTTRYINAPTLYFRTADFNIM